MSRGGEIICERIEEVRRLVIAATKCWFGKKGYESDDIIQEGLLGVMINRDAYDPERGSLGTFVTVTARRYVMGHRFHADAASKRRVNFEAVYLDQPLEHQNGIGKVKTLGDMIPGDVDLERDLIRKEDLKKAYEIIGSMDERMRKIILERHSDQPRLLSEIAKELCVSPERVRQLESAGLRRLRRGMGA